MWPGQATLQLLPRFSPPPSEALGRVALVSKMVCLLRSQRWGLSLPACSAHTGCAVGRSFGLIESLKPAALGSLECVLLTTSDPR